MSGIYIKGMEMPKSCFDCPFMYGRIYCCVNNKIEFSDSEYSELKGRYDGCPLIPVPDHGRLIDADDLERVSYGRMAMCGSNLFQKPYEVLRAISLATTIIPEDKEGEA